MYRHRHTHTHARGDAAREEREGIRTHRNQHSHTTDTQKEKKGHPNAAHREYTHTPHTHMLKLLNWRKRRHTALTQKTPNTLQNQNSSSKAPLQRETHAALPHSLSITDSTFSSSFIYLQHSCTEIFKKLKTFLAAQSHFNQITQEGHTQLLHHAAVLGES